MKVSVDPVKCQGNALCPHIAPDVFVLDDSERAVAIVREVPEGRESAVRAAASTCPERAIAID
jgi:ferredoxin